MKLVSDMCATASYKYNTLTGKYSLLFLKYPDRKIFQVATLIILLCITSYTPAYARMHALTHTNACARARAHTHYTYKDNNK